MQQWGARLEDFKGAAVGSSSNTSRALERIRSLRFHHLGFGIFWAVSFTLLWGVGPSKNDGAGYSMFLTLEKIAVAIVPIAAALIFLRCKSFVPSRKHAISAGVLLSASVICVYAAFSLPVYALALFVVAGLLFGLSNALFFLLWQVFFSTEGPDAASVHIPTSAVLSVVIGMVLLPLPPLLVAFITGLLLPIVATVCLIKSLSEVTPYTFKTETSQIKSVFSTLWRPTFCTASFGFVWQAATRLGDMSQSTSLLPDVLAFSGFAIAVLFLALFAVFSSRQLNLLRVYQALFPVITGAFLLLPFLGGTYGPTLSAILMFGFELVNMLLIFVCAETAFRQKISPIVAYGLSIGLVLTAMALGHITGGFFTMLATGYDFVQLTGITLATIYLLSVVLLLIFRKPAGDSEVKVDDENRPDAAASRTDLVDRRTEQLANDHGLSPREKEVAHLVVRGHNVTSISERLFISENTTRGHMKSIYRKLGIHSRQDLLDLVDPEE